MPLLTIRGLLREALDLAIGVTERFVEVVGDPDRREATERDRRALRASHDRLVEALKEIDDMAVLARVQQRELECLRQLASIWVPRDCLAEALGDVDDN